MSGRDAYEPQRREPMSWFQTIICILLAAFLIDGVARDREFNKVHAELRAANKVEAADLTKRDAEREPEVLADIAACSKVVDPIRCDEAFRCRQSPEQCVFERGDPAAVISEFHDREFTDIATDKALESEFTR